jgi:hypothetical protein
MNSLTNHNSNYYEFGSMLEQEQAKHCLINSLADLCNEDGSSLRFNEYKNTFEYYGSKNMGGSNTIGWWTSFGYWTYHGSHYEVY